jgi:Zn-dependent peptidase ImmA (M78 family)
MSRRTPEAEAQRTIEEHGILTPPVPVEQIAQRKGVRLAFEPFEGDLSGMLYQGREDGLVIIAVNATNAHVRQRFTIAHELGHLLLHRNRVFVDKPVAVRYRDARSSLAVSREEIEANRFAAALLMPREWVIDEANRWLERRPGIADEELVEALARGFDVSRQAMEYRLADLGIWSPI